MHYIILLITRPSANKVSIMISIIHILAITVNCSISAHNEGISPCKLTILVVHFDFDFNIYIYNVLDT